MMTRTLSLILVLLITACTTGEPLTDEEPEPDEQQVEVEEESPSPEKPDWYRERSFTSEMDRVSGYASGGASDEEWLLLHLESEAVSELRYRIDEKLERARRLLVSELDGADSPDFILSLRRAVADLELQPADKKTESMTDDQQIYQIFVRVDVASSDLLRAGKRIMSVIL